MTGFPKKVMAVSHCEGVNERRAWCHVFIGSFLCLANEWTHYLDLVAVRSQPYILKSESQQWKMKLKIPVTDGAAAY